MSARSDKGLDLSRVAEVVARTRREQELPAKIGGAAITAQLATLIVATTPPRRLNRS